MRRWLSIAMLGWGCRSEPVPPSAVTAVELIGCAELREHACTLPALGPLTRCERAHLPVDPPSEAGVPMIVWIEGDASALTLRIDGRDAVSTLLPVDGGTRIEFVLPRSAREFALLDGDRERQRWTVIEPHPEPPPLRRAREIASMSPEDSARAARLAALRAAASTYPPEHRAVALDILADAELEAANASTPATRDATAQAALRATELAFEHAQQRADLTRATCHARRGLFVAFDLLGDAETLARWHERLNGLPEGSRLAAGQTAYYRGTFARQMGDLQRASTELRIAEREAVRFGHHTLAFAATQNLASVLAALGREEEVDALLDRARERADSLPCRAWLHLLNNEAWPRLRLAELGRPTDDPIPLLDDVLLVLAHARADEDDRCRDDVLEEHARLNLALAGVAEGWVGFARAQAAELPPLEDATAGTEFWRAELEQRLVLADGDRGSLIEWAMRRPPAAPHDPERAWLHAWGRGQAFEALGLPDDALAAYRQAEVALDLLLQRLDFDGGRDRLLLGRQLSAGRMVDLLLARGDVEAALCSARIARSRTSHVLDRAARISALDEDGRARWHAAVMHYERQRQALEELRAVQWTVPKDQRPAHDGRIEALEGTLRAASETATSLLAGSSPLAANAGQACRPLPPLADGELGLLFFPLDRDGPWASLAFDRHGVTAHHRIAELPAIDAPLAAWSAALLEPSSESIDRARALRVLPSERLWDVPFAALPWRGGILLDHLPVSHALDLGPTPSGDRPLSRRGLVVADPRGDLPRARSEGEAVAASLRARGWTVDALTGDGATARTVRASLPDVDLLHYAGHGRRSGVDGWSSALRLSDEDIEVTDVLALPRVPRWVVLPACDTAPAFESTLGGDMNIARAFLLAGSEVVIASRGEIGDEMAERIGTAVHRAEIRDSSQAAALVRDALLAARTAAPSDPGWMRVVALVR